MAFSRSYFLAVNAIQSAGWFHVSGLHLYSHSGDIIRTFADEQEVIAYASQARRPAIR